MKITKKIEMVEMVDDWSGEKCEFYANDEIGISNFSVNAYMPRVAREFVEFKEIDVNLLQFISNKLRAL